MLNSYSTKSPIMSRDIEVENLCLKGNYNRTRTKIRGFSFSLFSVCILIFCELRLSLVRASAPSPSIGFREFNNEINEKLENDRPCNFLLDYNDAHLLTPGIIVKYGYPMERHWVTTDDGYILEMQRIPRGRDKSGKPSPAVFLMHGILSSSRDFVMNCDKRALAFLLYNSNYDVWLGNYRGNTYSRNHTSLSPDNPKFWNFSPDEVGYYDVPAMIDYVLNTTTLKEVSYVGHSMGNAVGLIMLTTRPEYNEKVNIWFAMSASASVKDTGSPLLRIAAAFPRSILWALRRYNRGELFPPRFLRNFQRFFARVCRREGLRRDNLGICSVLYFINDGYDPGQIAPELWTVVAGENPSSTSAKLLVQWMQWIISGRFAMFDEGPVQNLKKYGNIQPPLIPFEQMNTTMILMYGENDWIVSASDVRESKTIITNLVNKLRREPAPVEFFQVPSPHWNHLDFIYGKDADVFVYSHILSRLHSLYHGEDSQGQGQEEAPTTKNANIQDDTTDYPIIESDSKDQDLVDIRIGSEN